MQGDEHVEIAHWLVKRTTLLTDNFCSNSRLIASERYFGVYICVFLLLMTASCWLTLPSRRVYEFQATLFLLSALFSSLVLASVP